MLGLAMELLLLFPSGDAIGRDAVRFIMFARILRVLRIFSDLSRFSVIFSAFFELIPAFSKLGMVLLLIMCLFGQIATDVFDMVPPQLGAESAPERSFTAHWPPR